MQKKPLSNTIKLFYGIGDLGSALMMNVETYYFSFFLTDVAMLPLAAIGIITTVISAIDTILTPIYGVLMNSMKPMKWGRYRSWLIVGPILCMVTYPMMFSKIGSTGSAVVIILIGSLFYQAGKSFINIANMALIPMMASTDSDRRLLSSRKRLYAQIGRLVISYVLPTALAVLGAIMNNSALVYTSIAFVMALFCGAFHIPHVAWAKDYDVTETTVKTSSNTVKLIDMWHALTENKSMMAVFFANVAILIPNYFINNLIVYYFKYVAEQPELMAVYLIIVNCCGVGGAFLSGLIPKKFDTKKVVVFSLMLMIAFPLIARAFAFQPILFTIFIGAYNLINNFSYPIVIAMFTDCAIYSEYKTGKNVSGFVMSTTTIGNKIGTLTRGILIATSLSLMGYVAGEAPTQAIKNGICNVFSGSIAIFMAVALAIVVFGYKLTKKDIDEANAAIAQRKAEKTEA